VTVEVGYRVADWDTPLWVNPNRSPSRWWTPGAIVQYWSLHPLTPWAEYLRGRNVRTADEAGEIILRPWAAELELPDDTIELTFDSAAGHGLAPEALVDDDQTACQAWAASRRPSALPERRDGTGVGLTRLSVVPCMRARICELSAM
jgi:hypothetical protein